MTKKMKISKTKLFLAVFISGFFLFSLVGITEVGALSVVPGLKGFGTDTRAAYGLAPGTNPTVYKVTNLNSSGPGSLKECVDASGPRVCVFEVSGTIENEGYLRIRNPYITIAGQTAPSPGIMLKGTTLNIGTHDVLVQHLRVRPGDEGGVEGENRDGIAIATNDGEGYNIVVDHCSVSWGIDENIQFWYAGLHDITVSNCIISEGLDDSLHPDAPHSKGLLVGRDEDNLSIINNLFAHNYARNPVLYNSGTAVINNLIYNPKEVAISAAGSPGPVVASVVGNVVIKGENSGRYVDYALSIGNHIWAPWYNDGVGSKIYVFDNDCVKCTEDPWDGVDDRGGLKDTVKVDSPPVWPENFAAKPSSEVKDYVLRNAGARPDDRDSVDLRIINDVLAGTGRIIDCVTSEPKYFPTESVASATSNTVTLATSDYRYDDRFNGKKIIIVSGRGSGQSRIITDYDGGTKIVTISTSWNIIPDSTSKYHIEIDCSKNAGGWPVIAENTRILTLPANPHADDDSDGYTNLEEWLHALAADVEGLRRAN